MSAYNFADRHIGPREEDISNMLKVIEASSMEELIKETIPKRIRLKQDMNLPEELSESRFIEHMKQLGR